MSDLLNQLLSQAAAASQQKQEVSALQIAADEEKKRVVASKSDDKKLKVQANSANPSTDASAYSAAVSLLSNYGKSNLTPEEQLVSNNPQDNFNNLGGEEAVRLFNARNRGLSSAIEDTYGKRSGYEAIGDTTLDVVRGAGNMVAGPVALGAGLVNNNAGAAISQFIGDVNKGIDSAQSDSLNSRRKFNQTANQLDSRDNEAGYKDDLSRGVPDVIATLKREGKNALGTIAVGGSDAQTLLSATAQGVGSVVPVGAAAGLISKAAQGLGKVGTMVANNATPLAVGAMGAGGAYQGTTAKIMETPFPELAKISPEFVSLVQSGVTPEDARIQLANDAGKTAAAIAGPASALLGKYMPEFETLKLSKMPSASAALKGIPKEGVEEGTESLAGTLGQNIGIQQNVNSNQSISEGTGKDVGEGILAGVTTAGTLSSPRLVADATLATVNKTVGALVNRADRLLAENEANSPVAAKNLAKQSAVVADALPVVLGELEARKTEADPEMNQRIDSVVSVIKAVSGFNPDDYADSSDAVKAKLSTSKSKVEELLNLQSITEDESFAEPERYSAGIKLIEELTALENFVESNTDVLDNIPDTDEVKNTIASLKKVAVNVSNSPQFMKAITGLAESYAKKHEANPPLQALADPTSVEGKQAITEVLAVAKVMPEKANKEAISAIMAHSTDGTVPLSVNQKKTFQAAYTILDTFSKNNPKGEMLSSIDDVTGEAITNKDASARGDSALTFLNRISAEMASGDATSASASMDALSDFVQHFQNKVAALNKATGQANKIVKYDKLYKGKWVPDGGAVAIRNLPSALNVVTRILKEAETLGLMYNSLVSQFPKLGKKEFSLLSPDAVFLDQNNDGIISADALAKNMQWAVDGKGAPQTEPKTQADTQVTLEAETAAEGVPAEESVPSSVGSKAEAEPAQSFDEVFDNTLVDVAEGILKEREGLEKILSKLKESKALYRSLKGTLLSEEVKKLFGNNKSFNFFRSKTGTTLVSLIESGVLDAYLDADQKANAFEAADYIKNLLLSSNDKKYMTLEQQEAFDKAEFSLNQLTNIDDEKLNKLIDYFFQRSIEEARTKQERKQSARKPKADASKRRTESATDGKAEKTAEPRSKSTAKPEPVVTEAVPVSNEQASSDSTFASPKEEAEFLSNLPASSLRADKKKLFRLWNLKKELGTLSSNALNVFGELWSTAGNLLVAGTTVVSDNKASKQNRLLSPLGNPMEFLREFAQERIAGASNERIEAMASLVDYIDGRVNTVKKSLNTIVRDLFVKNDEATLLFTQLLQESPTDNIRNGKSLVHRFPRYRIFSILSPSDKSPIPVLNEKMLELAGLAYAQWELTLQNYKGHVEAKDVASLLGIEESAVGADMVAAMQTSTTFAEAQASLGKLILKYWSLEANKDAPSGFHEGIAGSLALEIIKAVSAKDNTNKPRIYVEKVDTVKDGVTKSLNLIKFNKPSPEVEAANKIFANFIEEASFAEHEAPMYFGTDAVVPVSDTVLRSPNQKLTAQQKAAQKNEQNTPHYLNMLSYRLYSAIGLENIYRLRKLPNSTEEKVLNGRTLQTVVGQKKGISAAFDKMQEVFFGLEEASNGGDMEQTPIRYKYEFISTGRLQMSGPQNPQANKLMRHVVLPTKDTVDLTNADMLSNFELAVAQGLGIKVHNMPRSKMKAKLLEKVSTLQAKKAIEGLQEWSKSPADPMGAVTMDWLSEFFGSDFSDAGLFALLEYSRFLGSSKQELANFTTSIYVEADGVTNGPAAAMYMMGAILGVSKKWLANMARTGYYISTIDQKDPAQRMSLNKYRDSVDNTDLYGVTGKAVPAAIQEMLSKASKEGYTKNGVTYPSGQRVAVATLEVIRSLLSGVTLSVAGDSVTATIDRSVTKNPLTTTVYGSGPTSTAVNLTKEALDNFYSKLSDIALARLDPENTATDDDLYKQAFGAEYTKLFANIEFISKNKLIYDRKSDSFFAVDSGVNKVAFDKTLQGYLITDAAVQSITNNIKHTFAVPIKQAIKEETGTVLDGSAAIIKITQTTGALMAREFNRLYAETVAKNVTGTRNYQKSDGISINDLRKIEAEMRKLFPFVVTQEQTFDISKSEMLPLDQYSIGRTLDDSTKVRPSVMVPTDPGVAGIPYLVIGLGDGHMMQFMAADSNGPQNTIKIYDGMHMKVSTLNEDSTLANKAVWEAWQGNPFMTLEPSFLQFVRNYDWKSLTEAILAGKEEGIEKIGKSFGVTYKDGVKQTYDKIAQEIASHLNSVYRESIVQNGVAVEATHQVLGSFQTSIDQMASAGAPYLHNPDGRILDTTDAQYLEKLNAEIAEKKKELAALQPKVNIYTEVLAKIGTAPVVQPTTVKDLLSKYAFKNAGAALTAALLKVVGNVPVVVGSPEFIASESGYAVKNSTNAFYDVKNNVIYIVEGKISEGEATLHEAIHAATYAIVANYYANPTANSAIANTISNLEKLMNRFFAETETSNVAGIVSARASIESATLKADKLNEFMAWGLSNKDSRSVLSKISSLVRQYVFKLFALNPTAVSKNLYEELVFETLSLLDTGVTSSAMNESAVLFHNTAQNVSTGDRIKDVSTFFYKVIGKHMESMAIPGLQAQARTSSVFTTDPVQFDTATLLSANATALLSSKFPGMTAEELDAASAVINALALSYKLDGNSLQEVEKLYNTFIKGITINDFLTVPEQQATQADVYEASEMFNVITGKFITGKDTSNRGQVLPIFFALALTNQGFRAILAKRAVGKGSSINKGSADDLLQSTATVLLEKLDNKLNNLKPNNTLQEAIDIVFNNLAKNAEERFSLLEAVSDKTGSVIDGLNDRTTQAVSFISDTLERKAKAVQASSNNKVVKGLASFAELGSRLLTDSKAAAVAEGLLSGTNQIEGFKPLRELMADFIGRTQSNELIYDMIKYVRSMVQQDRQDYRENLPTILAKRFSRELTKQEWSGLFNGIAKTDFAHLVDLLGTDAALSLLNDPVAVATRIRSLESDLRTSSRDWATLQSKAEQLAKFMNTGKAGSVLLRNATAINKFHGGDITKIDSLVSLYALRDLDPITKNTLSSLVQTEKDGLVGLSTYLVGLSKDENTSTPDIAINAYKGYIPSLPTESAHLIVANDTSFAELIAKSYVRIGDYRGSNAENSASKGYYLLKAPYRAAFSQGLMQNIHDTAGGIDIRTRLSVNNTSGAITEQNQVNRITRRLSQETGDVENLLPVFNSDGTVYAYERSLDPSMTSALEKDTHLAKMMGVWRGRQVEEAKAQEVNKALINNLHTMFTQDLAANSNNIKNYINLATSTDPVHIDALRLMPPASRRHIESLYGKGMFMVRRDMVNNAIGYRTPSVGDAWTGISGWSQETLDTAQKIAISIFGNKAYEYLVNNEQILKNLIQDAKLIIVVKSVVVPVGNVLSNILQLVSRGVPLKDIAKNAPKKLSEINFYTKQRIRKIEAEAELLSAKGDSIATTKLQTELDSIEDSFRRLSIWPLIEAGEFSAISDVGISRDDILLTEGRLHAYIERLTDKLPEGAKTFAKYGLVTKDTALFQGMQKAVEYGDFLAKALRYDHLLSQQKTKEEALAGITEEFVNYDLLMGRFREYGENVGLWWFTAFKVRSFKVALSIIRNNPVQALLAGLVPIPSSLGVGSPLTDNVVSKALDGTLGYSLGWGQALRAPGLNPWHNLVN